MTKRVLVVDDSSFVGAVLGGALRDAGFAVDVVHELADLESAAARRPDLVLMDVVLQEACGDDVAAMLCATGRVACPVLLMSSLPDDELARRAADAGLAGYITKRDGLAAIVARVCAALGEPVPPRRARALGFGGGARRSLRRVIHVMARSDRWNAVAMLAELHALAGDADIAGDTTIAEAARACHEVIAAYGRIDASPEILAGFDALAAAVGELAQPQGRRMVLVIDDGELVRSHVLPHLDAEGHVVMEARSAAEVRQKLRAADYDAFVVGPRIEPSLVAEIADHAPAATIVRVVDGAPADPDSGLATLDTRGGGLASRIHELLGR